VARTARGGSGAGTCAACATGAWATLNAAGTAGNRRQEKRRSPWPWKLLSLDFENLRRVRRCACPFSVTGLLETHVAWIAERDQARSLTRPIHHDTPGQRFVRGESQDGLGDLFDCYQDIGGILGPSLLRRERIEVRLHLGAPNPVGDEAGYTNAVTLAQPGQRGCQADDSCLGRVIPC